MVENYDDLYKSTKAVTKSSWLAMPTWARPIWSIDSLKPIMIILKILPPPSEWNSPQKWCASPMASESKHRYGTPVLCFLFSGAGAIPIHHSCVRFVLKSHYRKAYGALVVYDITKY